MGLCCSDSEKGESGEIIRIKPNSDKVGLFNRHSINMVVRTPSSPLPPDSWDLHKSPSTLLALPSKPRKVRISGLCSQKSEQKFVS